MKNGLGLLDRKRVMLKDEFNNFSICKVKPRVDEHRTTKYAVIMCSVMH